jgi:hypothetical protein
LKKIGGLNAVPPAVFRKNKSTANVQLCSGFVRTASRKKSCALAAAKTGLLPAPRERLRYTRNTQTPKPPTLPPETATAFSWPNLSLLC